MAGEKESPLYPLRSFELRLLRCSLTPDDVHFPQSEQPSNKKSSIHLHALIHELLQLIESGDYVRALSSDAARTVFSFSSSEVSFRDSTDSANQFYSEMVLKCVELFLVGGSADDDYQKSYRAFLVMAIAVAAFLAFTQCNFTGPLEKLPPVPLMELGLNKKGGDGDWVEWEVFARKEFMLTGSDLIGKFSNLQYIVFAKILLMRLRDQFFEESEFYLDGIKSISWWLARLFLFQQKILDEHSSYLFNLLQVFMRESLQHFGTVEKVKSYWGAKFQEEEAKTIVSMLHLEMGIVDYTYGRVDSSGIHFKSAEEVSGLHLSVSGALGFRTVHQIEPKAQLVLVANTRSSTDGGNAPSSLKLQRDTSTMDRNDSSQNGLETSDVLMIPRFLDVNNDSEYSSEKIENGTVADGLKAVQQAVILAQCLTIEKSSRQDKLQRWDMAPYIEAIDSQQSTYFIIRRFCDILRIRWESSRSHTKERALLMMEKLVQGVYEKSPAVTDRIYCCYGVHIPSIAALRKEYGDILVSCGLIGEAVKIYEDLELWDNLIYCYCLLEKKAAAVELIKKRLAERPSDPRLWCSLGDVTNNDACYEKALEVSENRSARAKRSLARSAYNRGEYEMSKILWESAMALNSLHPDGWFALGAAALKARDVEKALIGFTRAVQLDPENGEAWNNIACLHMIKKQSKESFIAFKEALKFKRNSWQMWENFSHVAADIGNFGQAIEALQKVLDLTNHKKFDAGLLERMILEIEQRASASCHFQSSVGTNQNSTDHINADSDVNCVAESTSSHVDLARTPETDHLLELLGKILTKIVGSTGGGPETLGLLARWHKLKGNLEMCSEALQKQLRSLQGSGLWRDGERFKKFAHASLELSKVYMELASHTSTTKDGRYLLGKAEMHLKSTIRQAGSFSEYKEFRDLQDCYDLVQTKLQEVLVHAE